MVTMSRVARLPRPLISPLGLIVRRLRDCVERARQRHYLAELDHRLLADAGLTRADQEAECNKPFWRA